MNGIELVFYDSTKFYDKDGNVIHHVIPSPKVTVNDFIQPVGYVGTSIGKIGSGTAVIPADTGGHATLLYLGNMPATVTVDIEAPGYIAGRLVIPVDGMLHAVLLNPVNANGGNGGNGGGSPSAGSSFTDGVSKLTTTQKAVIALIVVVITLLIIYFLMF